VTDFDNNLDEEALGLKELLEDFLLSKLTVDQYVSEYIEDCKFVEELRVERAKELSE